MILAATVTVYFIGLVHFVDRSSSGIAACNTICDAIAPLASPAMPKTGLTLEAHTAMIVIQGGGLTEDDCKAFGTVGTVTFTGTICAIRSVNDADISLAPAPSRPALDIQPWFHQIPKVTLPNATHPCPVSGVKSLPHAVHMILDDGKLDACPNGNAWVSFLTAKNKDTLRIAAESAKLTSDAVMTITNEPPGTPDMDPRAHYGWYYEMYLHTGPCEGVPDRPACASPPKPNCPACTIPKFVAASTDVGCSNSSYP